MKSALMLSTGCSWVKYVQILASKCFVAAITQQRDTKGIWSLSEVGLTHLTLLSLLKRCHSRNMVHTRICRNYWILLY